MRCVAFTQTINRRVKLNSEHVEVLRDLSEVCRAAIKAGDWKVDGACDPDSLLRRADAAIASLSAPHPPAEAQPVYGWVNGDAFVERENWTGVVPSTGWVPVYRRPPPSAPVGVEGLVAKWRGLANDALRRSGTWNGNDIADRIEFMADELEALAQQPTAFECPHRTRCDCLGACKYGYAGNGAIAQQPAAVDDATVEQVASAIAIEDTGVSWHDVSPRDRTYYVRLARAALTAQQGGAK